jgi:hypothetical protein
MFSLNLDKLEIGIEFSKHEISFIVLILYIFKHIYQKLIFHSFETYRLISYLKIDFLVNITKISNTRVHYI